MQIKEVFDEFDTSKKGFLKPADIRTALFKHGYTARQETVYHILSEYDVEGLGELSFDDFVKMCANTKPP